jgi:hypothetical protein
LRQNPEEVVEDIVLSVISILDKNQFVDVNWEIEDANTESPMRIRNTPIHLLIFLPAATAPPMLNKHNVRAKLISKLTVLPRTIY